MKREIFFLLAVSIVVGALLWRASQPAAVADATKHGRDQSVQSAFTAKDKEIASLKSQIVVLTANIVSLNKRIDELEASSSRGRAVTGAPAPTTGEPSVVVSDVKAQRFEGADFMGATVWLFTMTLSNNTPYPLTAPTVRAKFSDGSSIELLPYGGTKSTYVVVGNPQVVGALSVTRPSYFYSSRVMGTKTPIQITLTLDSSQVTVPVKAIQPVITASP